MPITGVFDRNAWIAGYLNLYDRRFDAWTAAPIASQRYTELYEAATATHQLSALNRLSAGYVLAPRPLPEFTPVAIANGVVAQRNRAAFPLAYFCSAATRAISGVSALAFDGNHVYVQVDAPADGEVIVTQQGAPGWRAQIDGRPANPRKSAIFRTLTVSRGHHEIVWSYRPLSLIAGAVVTLAGLVRLLFPPGFVKRSEDENFLRARPNSEV
jgi:hypothetical protein